MELHIAGQLRRTALAFQRSCPACSPPSCWPAPRIRPGGRDSSYRLARSDRPTGMNPLIAAVRCGGTPVFSILRAISSCTGMDRSRLLSPMTRAARRNRVCSSTSAHYGDASLVPPQQMRAALAPLPAAALRLAPETVEALAEVVPLRNLWREAFPGRELYYLVT
jgi:hypothetical protein